MDAVARYIEFSEDNLGTYSIELAHLLFAASSEVDVVAKSICRIIAPDEPAVNINHYRAALVAGVPDFSTTEVFVPRYGLTFKPWEAWQRNENPNWWKSYNNVKHKRDVCFNEATLQNALNALGGLLIMTFHFYRLTLPGIIQEPFLPKKVMLALQPESGLFRLHESNYYEGVVI